MNTSIMKRRIEAATRRLVMLLVLATPQAFAAAGSAAAVAAATRTAQDGANCKAIGDFYWEVGDGKGPVASGSIGDSYASNKPLRIASASKLVWGAYVLEKLGKGRDPSDEQLAELEMCSGHTAFNPIACLLTRTVGGCFESRSNAQIRPGDIGRFSYGGGHDQKLAVDLGLGAMNAEALTREVRSYLGNDVALSYARPQPAGGLEGTPAGYAGFLRKIINGQLRIKDYLGYKPVCTLPAACPSAVESPVKEAWHYSLNHWVEDDPRSGDGAYSSPGLEGFYPWISADRTSYGLIAREQLRANAYWASVQCGRDIRKAYFSGTAAP
ncbi:MAG: hypothetical protein NVS9B10_17220 [Nevskia sp.]